MSRADELRALLARVEDEPAGNRGLDETLHATLRPDDPFWRAIAEGRRLVDAGHPDQYVICPPTGPLGGESRMRADTWATSASVGSYTTSLNDARGLVRRLLPDWWASSGLCALSGHASIGPDYNGPAAERLKAEWPEDRYHEGFHADLKPGDGPHRECLALIAALLSALISQEAENGR